MSSTTTLTTIATTPSSLTINPNTGSNCPSCGYGLPPDPSRDDSSQPQDLASAQARIAELEKEVRILNEKTAMAVNRWAEYEVELVRLRSQASVTSSPQSPAAQRRDPSAVVRSPTRSPSYLQQSTERISALLYSRKSSTNLRNKQARPPALQTTGSPIAASSPGALQQAPSPTTTTQLASPTPMTPTNMTEDLLEALNREQNLRHEAEGRLSATSKEMEELSAALFEQANEMVADERRARAKLEERVDELEKRDVEKKKRLDRLESAVNRIERVKKLLNNEPEP